MIQPASEQTAVDKVKKQPRVHLQRKQGLSGKKAGVAPYLFILPFFLLFLAFILYPLIYSFVLSFSKWKAGNMEFVGLDNYLHLFTDPLFGKALLNTGIILLVQVPVMLILATCIAALLNSERLKFRGLLQVAFFLPAIIDLVTYSLVFSMFFNESSGMVNQLLQWLGLDPVAWRTDGFWAKILIICALTWRWTGYNSVIILSGLQMIPKELYEAASIDGAGRVRSFFAITVPQLKPVLLFCMILSTIGTLQIFTEPYVLTSGGPNNETLSAIQYLYQAAFKTFNFGLASAGAYIIMTIIAVLSYIQLRLSKGGEI